MSDSLGSDLEGVAKKMEDCLEIVRGELDKRQIRDLSSYLSDFEEILSDGRRSAGVHLNQSELESLVTLLRWVERRLVR